MTKWMNNHLWKIVIIGASVVAAYAVLTDDVRDMKPQVKANTAAIIDVEKDIIGVKGSLEALRIQQEGYHTDSNTKLAEILTAVKKRNDSP